MSIRHNGKIIAGATQYHPDLFDWKWADHQLDDVQWLRADTFSWQSGAVYESAYQHLVDDIDGQTAQTETVAGITISFYLANDGHKITTDESAVAQIYAATGVAWYYVLDTTNQRFKLPRTKFGVTGIRNGVGKFVEAGLPNLTGHANSNGNQFLGTSTTGVFSGTTHTNTYGIGTTNVPYGNFGVGIDFDASLSSSIYGNSTTVQPAATEMYLYFYVGNFTQTALENTAGINAELFNDKADLDFSNTTMIDYVVEKQDPTSSNNYTWYRKYKSGWVEQGGTTGANSDSQYSFTLPVAMSNTNYQVLIGVETTNTSGAGYGYIGIRSKTATSITLWSNTAYITKKHWTVIGIAAN